jgi:hypothetical protein
MSTQNYFSALDDDHSDSEVISSSSTQKRVVKYKQVIKQEVLSDQTDKKVNFRVKAPLYQKRVSKPNVKSSSRDKLFSQLVDIAISSKSGKKLSQKQQKYIIMEQKRKKNDKKKETF